LPVERVLLSAVPQLVAAEDACFAGALPILMRRRASETIARAKAMLKSGCPATRMSIVRRLLDCSYAGLPLLLTAFEEEADDEIKLTIAIPLAPVLSRRDLSQLTEQALRYESPSTRLAGTRLLPFLESTVAHRLARRADPEPMVDIALQPFRPSRREGRRGIK
jgi:hypothetical protein